LALDLALGSRHRTAIVRLTLQRNAQRAPSHVIFAQFGVLANLHAALAPVRGAQDNDRA
jgi:hypothetical protein